MKKTKFNAMRLRVKHDGAQDEAEALESVKIMAATIRTDREFIATLRDANPLLREQVYNLIKPHVHPSYQPRPFALMSFEADA